MKSTSSFALFNYIANFASDLELNLPFLPLNLLKSF